MKAEIIATGTELLLGEITDTNTPFIAGQLAALGIDLYYVSIIGDNRERLLAALGQALKRSELTILTGGLGPTLGDITREVIANLLGEKLEIDESLKQDLVAYFTRTGLEMPASNLKQATLIPSATALRNKRGTAPGWWVEKDGRIILALPGPPAEMQAMWRNEVMPKVTRLTSGIILSRTLKTLGLSEAKVNEMVLPYLSSPNPTLAMYAKPDGIHLRITSKATERDTAEKIIAGREAEIREILGGAIWGTDEESLEGQVCVLLKEKGLTLAAAETFTGGSFCGIIAAASGSGDCFKGGIIATSAASRKLLGQVGGEITAETAGALASNVRERMGAEIGIALDSPAADVALIAIDAGGRGKSPVQTYRARPGQLARRATYQALFSLRAFLLSL